MALDGIQGNNGTITLQTDYWLDWSALEWKYGRLFWD